MKLYLSSYRIPDSEALISLVGQRKNIRVAIIPNAKDYYIERARNVKLRENIEYMRSIGLTPEIIDLNSYTNPQKLKQNLQLFECVWVIGGNTFCLRYAMKLSGFDQIIKEVLNTGVVYIGESAGSCVAGKTLRGLETADNPEFAEEIILDGLNLLPNIISPHVGNLMFEKDTEYIRELYKDDSSLLELTDYQALVVNGNSQTVITEEN